MLLAMIQMIDGLFTKIIFLPMLYILYCRFTGVRKRGATAQKIYRVCVVLVVLFLIRCFCAKFIFAEVNYHRFTDTALSPVFRAIFYPNR